MAHYTSKHFTWGKDALRARMHRHVFTCTMSVCKGRDNNTHALTHTLTDMNLWGTRSLSHLTRPQELPHEPKKGAKTSSWEPMYSDISMLTSWLGRVRHVQGQMLLTLTGVKCDGQDKGARLTLRNICNLILAQKHVMSDQTGLGIPRGSGPKFTFFRVGKPRCPGPACTFFIKCFCIIAYCPLCPSVTILTDHLAKLSLN